MKSVRERFEEIWPVPEGVVWSPNIGQYVLSGKGNAILLDKCYELDFRLDTFTRFQETNPMVGVLVDDLIRELDNAKSFITDGYTRARITCTIENAKQIMEQKK